MLRAPKRMIYWNTLLPLVVLAAGAPALGDNVGTAFVYQGQLIAGGEPATGAYDMRFRMYSDPNTFGQVGGMLIFDGIGANPPPVNTSNGHFTVSLDFGNVFDGTALWLEIDVRPTGPGAYTTLAPRQPLAATPFALHALSGPHWRENGPDIYFDQGNVGIGTNAPLAPLHVAGSIHSRGAASTGVSVHNPNNDGASVHLSWLSDVARIRYGGSGSGSQNGLAIQGQGDATKLRLLDNGNLGLGDDDPQARLHLRTSDLALNSGALENDELIIEAQDPVIGLYGTSQGDWHSAISMKQVSGGNVVDNWGIARRTSTAALSPSALRFTFGADANFALNPTLLTLESDGKVGIGTAAPAGTLDVRAAGDATLIIGGTGSPMLWLQDSTNDGWNIAHDSADRLLFAPTLAAPANVAFTAAGRVGIGTVSPSTALHVVGDATVTGGITVDNGTLTVDNEDNSVGIGTTIPNAALDVRGDMILNTVGTVVAADATLHVYNGSAGNVAASASSELVLEDDSSAYLTLLTPDASERGVIFGSAADNNHGGLYYTNTAGFSFRNAGNLTRMIVNNSGQVGVGTSDTQGFMLAVAGSAAKIGGGSWSVFSDARLKKNVAALDGTLDRLLELRGVSFEYAAPDDRLMPAGPQVGFIAQEVEQVFPGWVDEADDGYKFVTVRGFEALTVEALRELRSEKDAQIAALQTQVTELQTLVARLLAHTQQPAYTATAQPAR